MDEVADPGAGRRDEAALEAEREAVRAPDAEEVGGDRRELPQHHPGPVPPRPPSSSSSSSAAAGDADAGERLKGSGTSGVTGLPSARDGKSSTLGDSSASGGGFLGGDAPAAAAAAIASGAIILRLLLPILRS